MLLILIKMLLMFAITIFIIFRVAESDFTKTFWGDILGYLLLGIGAFWKGVIYSHWLWDLPTYVMLPDEVPTLMVFIGVTLIVWSQTCFHLKRRSTDRRRSAAELFNEEEHRVA